MTEASNKYYQQHKEKIKEYAKKLYLKKKEGKNPVLKRKKYNIWKNNEEIIKKNIEVLKENKKIVLYFD
jgi:gamma-glutamyl phosphate reductase